MGAGNSVYIDILVFSYPVIFLRPANNNFSSGEFYLAKGKLHGDYLISPR
ncbi:hypothetical Protein YC6258_00049 [Gynuella sunshinyii YC6258]|uniref:Uncharacterized protein n=1 Tax=Gynuella sunshinyii YC6258 TaxID=1445510 RepID=A0A0C5UXR9_9GAMM|nr:hypothetical Protein YC6258_00049 [Gynuella sunshinyii YC6258]